MKRTMTLAFLLSSITLAQGVSSPPKNPTSIEFPVTISGVSATVRYDGRFWDWDAYVVNQKGEWISDRYKGYALRTPPAKDAPQPLVKGGVIKRFEPRDLEALFDDDPKTAFRIPTLANVEEYGLDENEITLTFDEPQMVDGFVIRPGWQKDLKTFDHFEKPGSFACYIETTMGGESHLTPARVTVTGAMPFDGKWISVPAKAEKLKAYYDAHPEDIDSLRGPRDPTIDHTAIELRGIVKVDADEKNMSERLVMFDRPLPVRRMTITFGFYDNAVNWFCFDIRNYRFNRKAYVSDWIPLFADRTSGNVLRDALVGVLRKIRDKKCEDLKILEPLPDLAKGVGTHYLDPRDIAREPRYDTFFRVFKKGYFETGSTIRLSYQGDQVSAFGSDYEVGSMSSEEWSADIKPAYWLIGQYPVLVVNQEGAITKTWVRDSQQNKGAKLP